MKILSSHQEKRIKYIYRVVSHYYSIKYFYTLDFILRGGRDEYIKRSLRGKKRVY